MKILHTSDWHLGISLNNISRIPDQKHFIEQIFQIIKEEKIGAVILAGDVFDRSVSSSQAISLYNEAVTCICGQLEVPMIIIAGNHDGAARLSACSELLEASGLYIKGKLEKDIIPIELNKNEEGTQIDIYSVPFFNIEEARFLYPEADIRSYDEAMEVVCGNIRNNMNPENVNIVVAHAYISGAILSESDKSATLGTASVASAEVFRDFSYTALGHIHKGQSICENVIYSGSPLAYSFSRADNEFEKCVMILDTEKNSVNVKFIKPLKEMRVLKGTYDELIENIEHCDDYMKIIVTDKYAGYETMEFFRSYYPNLVQIINASVKNEERQSLTIEEIEQFSPEELLVKFFQETYQQDLGKDQIDMFISALKETEREVDLS